MSKFHWKFHPSTCLLLTSEQVDILSKSHQDTSTSAIDHFGCPHKRGCLVHMDNMRYINHCATPNTQTLHDDVMVAARDILSGEELFEDYNQYTSCEYCVKFLG